MGRRYSATRKAQISPSWSGSIVETKQMKTFRNRVKLMAGHCLDLALGVFLIAMLAVIWTSSRTAAGSVKAASPSSNISALTPVAGTICIQDDSSPGNFVQVTQNGDYNFCCGGVTIASGTGTITTRGNINSIDGTKGDRQVHIEWDFSANNGLGAGTAYVEKLSSKFICQITDRNMSNDTCQCGNTGPPLDPKKPPNRQKY
jgi:hypothetical protein